MPDGSNLPTSGLPDAFAKNPLGVFPFSIEAAGRELTAIVDRAEAIDDFHQRTKTMNTVAPIEDCVLVAVPKTPLDALILLALGVSAIDGEVVNDSPPGLWKGNAAARRACLFLMKHCGVPEDALPWMLYLGSCGPQRRTTAEEQDVQRIRWLEQQLLPILRMERIAGVVAAQEAGESETEDAEVVNNGLGRASQAIMERLTTCKATTLDGLLVKMRAIRFCREGTDSESVHEMVDTRGQATDERLLVSLLRDLEALAGDFA